MTVNQFLYWISYNGVPHKEFSYSAVFLHGYAGMLKKILSPHAAVNLAMTVKSDTVADALSRGR